MKMNTEIAERNRYERGNSVIDQRAFPESDSTQINHSFEIQRAFNLILIPSVPTWKVENIKWLKRRCTMARDAEPGFQQVERGNTSQYSIGNQSL
jgi:hypothetical protein